jgi:hypothetical protein
MPSAVPGDLKIHIAVMVLGTGDVREDRITIPFHHEAHRDTRNRAFLMGTPASIKLKIPPQTEAIDDEPFDS